MTSHDPAGSPPVAPAPPRGTRDRDAVYLATIAVGHGLKHWYAAAFAVFLPLIQREFGLTDLGVAALVTARQLGGGLPNFFVGYVADRLRGHWHPLLAASFAGTATAMMLAGLAPWVAGIALGFALASAAAAFWHPPAIAMLSARFPHRRGMAIGFHGAGSGAGEALGPLVVGLVLARALDDDWRLYVVAAMLPAVAITGALLWMLRGARQPAIVSGERPAHPADLLRLLRSPVLRALAAANFSRSLAHFGLLAFLPVYLANDLGMDSAGVGAHVALLTLVGVAAGPLFGHLSDRVGRRGPIVLALAAIAGGSLAMGIAGSGIALTLALAFTGVFLWSVQDVVNATAMDAAPAGSEGSVVGLMFTSSFVAAIIAPGVAGAVVTLADDRAAVFFLAAAAVTPVAAWLALAPFDRAPRR